MTSPDARFVLESPLFHVTHIVDDGDLARSTYQRLFARPIVDAGYWDLGGRWAIFVYVGDVWVEAALPNARPSGLRSFTNRFGSRLHSLAWYVRNVDQIANDLRDANIRFAEDPDPAVAYRSFQSTENAVRTVPRHGAIPLPPGYRHAYPADWLSGVIYTHFRDTHGMLEFCEPTSYHVMPPRLPDPDMCAPSDDPLTLVRSSHHTIVVPDASAAATFWVERFGATRLYEGDNDLIGSNSSWVSVGEGAGTVLEFAQPAADGPAKADLERCGLPILHAVTFLVTDLDRVRAHLASEGFAIESDNGSSIVTDPSTTAGARFGFTVAPVPGAS
jgi:catechol 2,3-dioxygenase-like lactoylglutathione lyase family enzyme